MVSHLPKPHGSTGELKELLVKDQAQINALKKEALTLGSIGLSPRQLCDFEMLAVGGFSPLEGFMTQKDYESVVNNLRLADNTIWPMPITLDLNEKEVKNLSVGSRYALRDGEGNLMGILTVEDIYSPNREDEAQKVFKTTDTAHPAVNYLLRIGGAHYVGGKVEAVALPNHYDFLPLRRTPSQLRSYFDQRGWTKVVAFQTRNPMHRAHKELTFLAAKEINGNVLIHPVVGMTKPGDVDYFTRVRAYKAVLSRYPDGMADLSLLPLAMRMGGPREALWHAIIRKNYGCSHFIVGRDHAGPGKGSDGKDFYGPYEAQDMVRKYSEEADLHMVPFQKVVYVEDVDGGCYMPHDKVPEGSKVLSISGTEVRNRLQTGAEIPEWFSYGEVVEMLRQTRPPRINQGFAIFFTGLSGSGKSTIANALRTALLEDGSRPVTLLDGDIVRRHLSSELGFSKEHRDLNITRIGFVASQIVKARGIVICAPIAPYREARRFVREMIEHEGGFIEIFVDTPLEVCEQRDVKGLYAKARSGFIKGFTGIDDPYEEPTNPELKLNTADETPLEHVNEILNHLRGKGYLSHH